MSVTAKVDFPVYAAQFHDDNTAIIAGGGGEGNNGIPNKIAVLSIDLNRSEEKVRIAHELEIEGKNDSPTGLALAKSILLVGQNESSTNVKSGINKHLRKFSFNPEEDKPLSLISSVDIEASKDPNDYQKITSIASDGSIAAIVSSKVPSVLRIINPVTLEVKESIELNEGEEINGVSINQDGSKIAYVTNNRLTLIQDGEKPTLSYDRFSSNYILSKVKFAKDGSLVVGVNLKNGVGVLLLQSRIEIDEETGLDILKTKKARVVSKKFKKITAIDISQDVNEFIAVSGNDNSVVIADFTSFQPYKTLKKLHSFAITSLSFSPNGKYLLSTSAANTVNVYEIPSNIRFSIKPYITSLIFLIISVVVYHFISEVTDEQWNTFNSTVAYLFGEEYIPLNSTEILSTSNNDAQPSYVPADAIKTEAIESIPTENAETDTEATESFEQYTSTQTIIHYETETIINDGDIVDIKIRSIANKEQQDAEEKLNNLEEDTLPKDDNTEDKGLTEETGDEPVPVEEHKTYTLDTPEQVFVELTEEQLAALKND